MIFFPLFMKNKMYNEQTHRGIVLMVEQRSPKPTVEGSSPSAPATSSLFLYFFKFSKSKIKPKNTILSF